MEHHLWAYTNDFGWFAIDPSMCDYDRDKVDTAETMFEAETKHELMNKVEAAGEKIAMWLE
jgi:hypothetical protein